MKPILGFALLVLCSAGWAHDGEQEGRHDGTTHTHWWLELEPAWYAGAALGQSTYDDAIAVNDDGSFTSRGTDDTDSAFRVFVGVDVSRYFGVELGYVDLGETTYRAQSDGSGSFWAAGPVVEEVAVDGFDLGLVARMPLTEAWSLFGKAAAFKWQSALDLSGTVQGAGFGHLVLDDDGTSLSWGTGVRYQPWRAVAITAEYAAAEFDVDEVVDGKADSLAISVAYRF